MAYQHLHGEANGGQPRPDKTYDLQQQWIRQGNGMLVGCNAAFAFWILYEGGAYYASGPSVEKNVQHAVIWKSLELLKAQGIRLVELGQIDGETEKERNIGKFKAGFGGTAQPFTIARRRAA